MTLPLKNSKKILIHSLLFSLTLILSLFSTSRAHPLYAVTTRRWIENHHTDFIKGKLKSISVQSSGRLSLSPKKTRTQEIPATYVWCQTSDETDSVFIGTGDPGTIFKISRSGDITEFYKTPELHIQTIATDTTGNLYAGTIPHGRIYKVTPDGKGELFCDLPCPYVWDLLFDGNGKLYAATGNEGILYKISEKGIPSVFFDSPSTNILDLIIDHDDSIYAASEPEGIIYKITAKGNASVLYDTKEDEIHCLALSNKGVLYAGTASGTPPVLPTPAPSQPELVVSPPPVSESLSEMNANLYNVVNPTLELDFGSDDGYDKPLVAAKNTVYKIDNEGRVSELLAVEDSFVLCLSVEDNDDVLVGTGNKAKLLKINTAGDVSLLYDFKESQILGILTYQDGTKCIATGNSANLYLLSNEYSHEGIYESAVHDASYISTWGCISWNSHTPKQTGIKFYTRSGNSSKPDITWSGWSSEYEKSGEKITSPAARFIQYRILLTSRDSMVTPIIDYVCIHYLPQNQPPFIQSIEITSHDSQKEGNDDSKNIEQGRRKPTKLLSWKSNDPNGDLLMFDLMYKKAGEKNWKVLKSNISHEEQYYWNTKAIPDGYYEVKVIANDIIDNPAELALKGEKTSSTFLIDNTQPAILELTKILKDNEDTLIISGNTRDEMCNISEIRYSIDAGEQKTLFPTDKIFDSNEESFLLNIPYKSSKGHNVIIEATDAEGNVGSSMKLYIP